MAELLYWIALNHTDVPNKVLGECIYCYNHKTRIEEVDS